MQENKNQDLPKEVVTTNRSLRASDATFERFKQMYTGVEGVNQELALKDLLDLKDRIYLEGDKEYGSQIKQVNELTVRIGEIFSSVIKQSTTKSELEVSKYEKLKTESSEELRELKEKVKDMKEQLEKEKKESNENWHAKYKLEKEIEELKADSQKRNTEFEERIIELKTALQEKEEKIASKNEKVDQLEKQIESMQRDLSANEELKVTVLQLRGDIELLQKQHEDELKNKDFELERALFAKEKGLQEAFNQQFQEQSRKIESVRDQLDVKRDEITELREKLSKIEAENSVLQKENTLLKQESVNKDKKTENK